MQVNPPGNSGRSNNVIQIQNLPGVLLVPSTSLFIFLALSFPGRMHNFYSFALWLHSLQIKSFQVVRGNYLTHL